MFCSPPPHIMQVTCTASMVPLSDSPQDCVRSLPRMHMSLLSRWLSYSHVGKQNRGEWWEVAMASQGVSDTECL